MYSNLKKILQGVTVMIALIGMAYSAGAQAPTLPPLPPAQATARPPAAAQPPRSAPVAPPAAPALSAQQGGASFQAPPPPLLDQTQGNIDQQALGLYPVMERNSILPLGSLQRAWDAPFSSAGQATPGVMRYVWRPDFIMAVRTREFMVTTVHLPTWESITDIIVGDPVVFEATRVRANILAFRPNHAGADTNITVIGVSGNVYSFYVRSEGWNSDQVTDLTVYVSANRVDPTQGTAPSNNPMMGGVSALNNLNLPDYLRQIIFRPDQLRFNLRILAPTPEDVEIAPERVFTDGVWTYFDFGSRADIMRRPVIYLVQDGVDTLVNTRTAGPQGNVLIAEAVGNFTLRNGKRVVCVRDPEVTTFTPETASYNPQGGVPAMENQLIIQNNTPAAPANRVQLVPGK